MKGMQLKANEYCIDTNPAEGNIFKDSFICHWWHWYFTKWYGGHDGRGLGPCWRCDKWINWGEETIQKIDQVSLIDTTGDDE